MNDNGRGNQICIFEGCVRPVEPSKPTKKSVKEDSMAEIGLLRVLTGHSQMETGAAFWDSSIGRFVPPWNS